MNRATRNRLNLDMRTARIIGALAAAFMVAACVPRPAAPARAPAPPPPRPAPPPPEPPPPPPASWEDAPLSPGDWSYRDEAGTSSAGYAGVGLMCDENRHVVISIASGAAVPPRAIIVRTTYGERRLPAAPDHGHVRSGLAADDPLLDQIAFSRGRFLLQAEGGQPLIVPSWPEPARVIEDCRA